VNTQSVSIPTSSDDGILHCG